MSVAGSRAAPQIRIRQKRDWKSSPDTPPALYVRRCPCEILMETRSLPKCTSGSMTHLSGYSRTTSSPGNLLPIPSVHQIHLLLATSKLSCPSRAATERFVNRWIRSLCFFDSPLNVPKRRHSNDTRATRFQKIPAPNCSPSFFLVLVASWASAPCGGRSSGSGSCIRKFLRLSPGNSDSVRSRSPGPS